MNSNTLSRLSLASLLLLSGCQLTDQAATANNKIGDAEKIAEVNAIQGSYLGQTRATSQNNGITPQAPSQQKEPQFNQLPSISATGPVSTTNMSISKQLDTTTKNITFAADGLNLSQFIHQVFGEMLKLDYILDDKAAADTYTVSLNINEPMTQAEAYRLTQELLSQRQYSIVNKNNVLYIISTDSAAGAKNYVYGVGQQETDIPAGQDIFQVVPLLFARAADFSLIIRSISKVQVSQSQSGNLLYLQGPKEEISKTLDFIRLVDRPTQLAKNVGLIDLVYSQADEFSEQIKKIMAAEGLQIGINDIADNSAVLVPMPNKGMVVIFAKSAQVLQRIRFWSQELDKADNTGESSYFIYRPDYARAADLGESLSNMLDVSGLGSTSSEGNSNNNFKASQQTSRRKTNGPGSNNSVAELRVSVDERSNTLIISGTSAEYQKIRPLLRSLDVLPKQIMLEMTIAEVTLKDDFKQGVEWAFSNGRYSMGTKGAFGLEKVGGFSYSLTGVNGSIQASLSQDNNLVNVLSRPSIVVRDGVSAAISVGTDIPVVGETTTDPISGDRQTTSIEYRKTGIELEVTPTVNSQGVVIMEINQKISNTVDGGVTTGGSPSVFERSIKTEVVAGSGQTVILGGLISKNHTVGQTKIPLLGDIPIIGTLFRVDTDNKDKTELVVLVTPKIIERQDEWDGLKIKFFNALDNLKFEGDTSSAN